MENTIPFTERRRHKRIEHGFVMRFRLASENLWGISSVTNISESGIFFRATRLYQIGHEMDIWLTLPKSPCREVKCTAKVVRCDPAGSIHNIYGVAIDISSIETQDRLILHETMDFFLEKENKSY